MDSSEWTCRWLVIIITGFNTMTHGFLPDLGF